MQKLNFNSFAKSVDGQEYCSEVSTYAENIIEGNEKNASVIYPSRKEYASFRGTNFRKTEDNLVLQLPFPIYKILSVKLKPNGVKVYREKGSSTVDSWEDYVDENGNSYVPDITAYILLKEEWDALKQASSFGETYYGQSYKENTFYYEQGTSILKCLATTYKHSGDERPVYDSLIRRTVNKQEASNYKLKGRTQSLYGQELCSSYANDIVPVFDWLFQIEYIPMSAVSATKLKAHKNEELPRVYTQVVNQRAEVSNAEAFGKYLHATAQKTGTEKLAIAKTYKRLAEVPPVGAIVNHNGKKYRLVANSYRITNTVNFTVVHTLSKDWMSKSKHVAVDQKYRNWAIPFNSYMWRTIYYEEFIRLSGSPQVKGLSSFAEMARKESLQQLFSCAAAGNRLEYLYFFKGNTFDGVVLPVLGQGVGKSLVFSGTMQDNLSAGLRVSETDDEYFEEVLYCNEDGTLNDCRIVLAPDIEYFNANVYPKSMRDTIAGTLVNTPSEASGARYFEERFWLDKDPGEAIKTTIQCHFLAPESWICVGNMLAENHPFLSIKKKQFRIWLLRDYIRNGVDRIAADTAQDYVYQFADDAMLSYVLTCDGNSIKIVDEYFNNKVNGFGDWKAWAITDENNNLYVGSNDITKRQIYFSWERKGVQK